jgi:type IV pilus assembly protein PilV
MGHAMTQISLRNKNGFTLIEVMVSIIILMVGLLGLLQAINVATEHNIKNSIRTEAVQVGENKIVELKLKPYDNISALYQNVLVPSRIRGVTKNFNVSRSSSEFHAGSAEVSKELIVRVGWIYKNISSNHEVHTIKTR